MNINITKKGWDFSHLFKKEEDIRNYRKKVEQETRKFVDKWKKRDDYLEKPDILRKALEEYESWVRDYENNGREIFYFSLRTSLDQRNPDLRAKENKADEFSKKISNDIRFFELRLSKIPKEKQKIMLEHESLKNYKHFLERLFESGKHILKEEEEKIISLKSSTSYEGWVKMVNSLISKEERQVLNEKGKNEKKNFSEIMSLLSSRNRKVRDSANKAFNNILAKYVEVGESEINSVLQDKKVNDELRKFDRPDKSRHLSDDIDSEVVDALLKAVSSSNHIARNYYKLKSKLFKVKKLKYHERNVPYGNIEKKYIWKDSVELAYRVFKNLDDEFAEIFKDFIEEGRMDVYPKKDKNSGAFCADYLISDPTYILLNHTDKLEDVTVVAHETGHGINSRLMKNRQNPLNFGVPMSTAEVASTFMEDFVLQEIMKEADDELKLALMMMKLNSDVSSIHRQIGCYKFEMDIHNEYRKKGYLSTEEIGKLFQKNMKDYMGDYVEQSKGSENWWLYWSHIRTYFYVYSYASGLLISKAMQRKVKEDHRFIEKVKEFLSSGLSDSPKNIFLKMGIDITDKKFWESGLKEIEDLLAETGKLAKKLGKLK